VRFARANDGDGFHVDILPLEHINNRQPVVRRHICVDDDRPPSAGEWR
jgi:hypothetical protein